MKFVTSFVITITILTTTLATAMAVYDKPVYHDDTLIRSKEREKTLERLQKIDDTIKGHTIQIIELTNDIIEISNKKETV